MYNELHLPFLLLFGIVSIILFVSGYIGKLVRFPTIIFFIFAGLILGNIVHQEEVIEKFSEIGIVLLFSILDLNLTLKELLKPEKNMDSWSFRLFVWIYGNKSYFLKNICCIHYHLAYKSFL